MATKYGKPLTPKTPQNRPIPGREADMQPNAAGGYAFKMGGEQRLQRWLILGSETGTIYEDSNQLTAQNIAVLREMVQSNPAAVVPLIKDVRKNDWAMRLSPLIFALAYASTDAGTRRAALDALSDIAQNASQLMEFLAARKDILGKAKVSRSIRTAVEGWYNGRDINGLIYQILKYRTRNGFSHADILSLYHVKPVDAAHEQLFAWLSLSNMASDAEFEKALKHMDENQQRAAKNRRGRVIELAMEALKNFPIIADFELLQATTDEKAAALLIRKHNFTREMVPTTLLNSRAVWEALVEKMPYEALIRNLNKITAIGLTGAFKTGALVARITDVELIRKSRVHPMRIFTAWKQYSAEKGEKGSLTWDASPQIVGALEEAFYKSFVNVEPSQKNIVVAVDVSGSMRGATVYGIPNTDATEVAAAMTLVYLKANPNALVLSFDTGVRELPAHAGMSIQQVIDLTKQYGGGTNCALPFEYIQKKNIPADGVLMITDSETWAGHQHVTQAKGSKIKFFNVQTTASRASLNDPKDTNWFEVAGFSADTVKLAELFFAGRI